MRKYVLAFAAGLLLAGVFFYANDILYVQSTDAVFRILSDGCFLSGVILCGSGILSGIAGEGFFDIFSYGFRSFVIVFRRDPKERKMQKTFAEYRKERLEQKSGFWHLLVPGILFLLLAVLFSFLFTGYAP